MTGPDLGLQLVALVALILSVIVLLRSKGAGEGAWAVFLLAVLANVELLRRLFKP